MPLVFESVKLECGYRIDLLIENKVVIEIKSVEALTDIHMAQTLTYLKLGNYKLGLLINFNVLKVKDGLKRIINGSFDLCAFLLRASLWLNKQNINHAHYE
jgi:GxxExxY protein